MSTLNGPIWSRCSIALICPARSHSISTGKDGTLVGMNVTAYQKKEKTEEMKTGKRKAGEGRRQATDFKEAASWTYAVVQGAAR